MGNETQDLASAASAIGDAVKAALTEHTKTITQSNEAALKAFIEAQRLERAAATNAETEELVKARVADALAKYEAEHARTKATRQTEMDLSDARLVIGEAAQVMRAETKSLFTRYGAQRAQGSHSYRAIFEDRTPFDVLHRGAFIPKGDNYSVLHVTDPMLEEFRDICDKMFFWRSLVTHRAGGIPPAYETCPLWSRFVAMRGLVSKALDTTDTSNWVPTSFSSELIAGYDLERNLAKQMVVANVPRFPFDWPVISARTTTYKLAEQTADPENATKVTTSDLQDTKVTFQRNTMGARTSWSYELEDDSIIAMANECRNQLARSLAYSEEQALTDGDDSTFHFDNDVSSSTTDVRKLFKGLRKHAVGNSYTTSLATFSSVTLKNMIKALDRFGVRYSELLWVFPPKTRADLLTLTDGTYPVMTGIPAGGSTPLVVTQGDVPSLFGIRVIVSETMRTDLNASGFYDGTTVTKSAVILFNRQGFRYAMTTAAPLIESFRDIQTRQMILVASMARDFDSVYAIASHHVVDCGINIA